MPITKDTPGVEIELFCEPEDRSPEGDFASGDDADDAETVAWIRDQLDRGNEWAWCCAHVRVTYDGIVADEYLGGCSYHGEREFRAETMPEMVETCLDTINAQLAAREPLKINLTEMTAVGSGRISQMDRDMAIRQVARDVRASANYGAKHEYTTCGDQLALAVTGADGYTRVYDCKVLRCATFLPDGTQLK
jgi:hypothetical protein